MDEASSLNDSSVLNNIAESVVCCQTEQVKAERPLSNLVRPVFDPTATSVEECIFLCCSNLNKSHTYACA